MSGELKAYMVGGGIASLAAAAYMIRDGKVPGENICIFEELSVTGGSMDGIGEAEKGYVIRGGRMMNFTYYCTYDLCSFIPSLTDPSKTVLQEINEFNAEVKTCSKARVVDHGQKVDVSHMGFSRKDRMDLNKMIMQSEESLGTKRIDECFQPSFFKTNFWMMWATMFAFQPWHSAVEFKRYLHRFIHEFPRINTLAGVDRTPLNQYDSIIRPVEKWLREQHVQFDMGSKVTNLAFTTEGEKKTVTGIQLTRNGKTEEIKVNKGDLVFVTNGSMTADSSLGSMHSAPKLISGKVDGSWKLWENIAKNSPQFGSPANFDGRAHESLWESFTTTCKGDKFFKLVENYSGNTPGTGALITFRDSNWLMSIVLAYQPHFLNQPKDVTVFWGYGLFPDKVGNYVQKKMSECTGEEIMTELCYHLGFTDDMKEILATSNCIPCMMPYITSQFLTRAKGDRPQVVPEASTNLAFLGQFAEVPEDVVFTVEYSVRTARMAVYQLMKLDKKVPSIYHGQKDVGVILNAMKTMYH